MNDHSKQVESGAVLITVNQRLARHHMAKYQRWQLSQGCLWWDSPAILPLRAWLRSVHAKALSAGLSTCSILPDLLQLQQWHRCLEVDDELALLDLNAATQAARGAWELSCAYACRNPEDDYLPMDQRTWQRWCNRYTQALAAQSQVDEASLADHLIEIIASGSAAGLLPKSVILEGFIDLPAQLLLLVDTLRKAGVCVEVATRTANAWVLDKEYEDDEQEMLAIATQMRTELERDIDQSLGLVVPNLQKRRTAVMRAFDRVFFPALSPDEIRLQGRPYDLSLGIPLSETGVVMTALSLLNLVCIGIRGSEVSAVLLSPYLASAREEARHRERLDRRLRNERVRALSLEQLQHSLYSKSVLKGIFSELLKRRNLRDETLYEWAARFSDWLTLLEWPGKARDSEEHQAMSAWFECLDDMQLLDDGKKVSMQEALQTVRRLAHGRIFQLDTPRTPIQIMGRLESHGIDFDCLWIAGLDTEQWPPASSPSPFLSIARQKQQGVPGASAAARLALAEKEFLMWGSQAPLLVASHSRLRDGKSLSAAAVPKIVASMANQSSLGARLATLQQPLQIIDPARQIQSTLQLESVIDDCGPALEAGSEVSGGARLFEDQALCPFRAFALHRLRIRPLEEAGLGLDPRQHGDLLHTALELFWKSVGSHETLMAMSEETLTRYIHDVVEQAIEATKVPVHLRSLESRRLSALIREWLEQCEAPRQAFEVVSLEQRQSIEHGGIVMHVMLDRIDRVADSLVVVDYKTGTSNTVTTWADKRIINPQLPLYVLTNEAIEGAAFAQVARNQCGFKGVASDDTLLPRVKTRVQKSRNGQASETSLEGWTQWRTHWRQALDVVAAEVRQGLATITPMNTACQHCVLKSLCRIDELALQQLDEDVDGVLAIDKEGETR